MEMKHILVLQIGIPLVLLLAAGMHFLRRRAQGEYRGGIRSANADFIRNLPEYQTLLRRARILSLLFELALIGCMICTLVLIARPFRTESIRSGVKKRDIFLCLDVSYSLYDLNYQLVDHLEHVVEGLEGDRFGISIYNTSSVLFVPMTDDYDFVLGKLEELKTYFRLQKEYDVEFGDYEYLSEIPDSKMDRYYELQEKLDYLEAGTLVSNHIRGSSLIGEGLATCLYSFPRIEEDERTRMIIMATDNSEQARGKPLLELDEAASYCMKYGVRVYGIFPGTDTFDDSSAYYSYEDLKNDLRKNVEMTGGVFYVADGSLSVPEIVRRIQEHEATAVRSVSVTRQVDRPVVPFRVLAVLAALMFTIGLVLKR